MAAGGRPLPAGSAPRVSTRVPPARRRPRRPPAPPFQLQRSVDGDAVFLVPTAGGPRDFPPRPPPRKRRRRGGDEDDEDEDEGAGGEADGGASAAPGGAWGTLLPPEILLRILHWGVRAAGGAVPLLGRASRVCRLWRRVAADPRLWLRVQLGGDGTPGPPPPGPTRGEGGRLRALRCLPHNRFSQLQEFVLSGWKSHVGALLQMLSERCPNLRCLELRHCQVEPGSLGAFLAVSGPPLRQLVLSCGPRLGPVLGALAGGRCPELRLLELDAGLGGSGPPLPLPVESLQGACPSLQVLRLLNLRWAPRAPPPPGSAPPGFVWLRELSLAGAADPGGGDALLRRLLRRSGRLALLDLRGCARVTPRLLLELPCHALEQLYLGLPCGTEQLPRVTSSSAALTWHWRRSLRELDLSGRSFTEQDLAGAMAAFPPGAPLRSLNLAGTRVTAGALSGLLATCPGLAYLNLSSCRHLPRGTKRPHRGCQEVQSCLRLLGQQPGTGNPGQGTSGEEQPNQEPPSDQPNQEPPSDQPNQEPPSDQLNQEPHSDQLNQEQLNEQPNQDPPSDQLNQEQPNQEPPQ
ncbi:F-box/LRR-repeat protein 6 [Patagioenas fasciata]|uniref:F-box/LRR-repeat protein 6 n=1 Tax=Patagioenas fasciata TaxID=372321 RepID=UPI003A99B3CD